MSAERPIDAAAIYDHLRSRETLFVFGQSAGKTDALYPVLFRAIADDDYLFDLSCEAQPGQLAGLMLLSAVHYLVLNNPEEPLADYYGSVRPDPRLPGDVVPIFTAFCHAHEDEIIRLLRSRTLQTTSTSRAMGILLSLDHVAKQIGEPFSIVEIGCSAGLLTLFDHYRYDFGNGEILDTDDAPFTVVGKFVGKVPQRPKTFPRIRRRIGLDLAPLDPQDPDVRNWVVAQTIADWPAEVANLRAALEYRADIPIEVVKGDALETLPSLLDEIEGPVCVYHSQCLYQWPAEARASFDELLRRRGRERTIHRIGIEMVGDALSSGGATNPLPMEILHTIYSGAGERERLLGRVGGLKDGSMEWTG
ncbi:DUF2332 domain-containing protein [Sphingosinicella rhizophila]|uniref:DUF2332 domain-containing protein n=1 Tax=Sphingosinicella rhizophila TaxID=3050082 RepID=A0ABU3Q616_9SPHN|nr:DUF2332 domain-containing protein [Sphingosinicella sp. GR2756]MDT9598742.1 DUF2332 domain-containing protein [Sphingosinicella sp. GR2756]